MRGRQRVVTKIVLLTALLVGALFTAGVPAWCVRQFSMSASLRVGIGLIVGGFAVAFELGGLRPLAVHRQVPQWWGHRYGPVAAAARYGLRLGSGPATILTTWLWWLGWAAGVLGGVGPTIAAAIGFSLARFTTMAVMAWGSPSGTEIAQRVQRLQTLEQPVRRVAIIAANVSLAATLFAFVLLAL